MTVEPILFVSLATKFTDVFRFRIDASEKARQNIHHMLAVALLEFHVLTGVLKQTISVELVYDPVLRFRADIPPIRCIAY
ncbi:MAG: hypothetical protein ABEH64_09690 [Salinirussus sp.]